MLNEVNALTTFLQQEVYDTAVANVEDASDYFDQFKKMPDHESIAIMEKNMTEVLKVVPMAHVIGLNLVTSLIGSMAATSGVDLVVEAIEEINQNTFNDDT